MTVSRALVYGLAVAGESTVRALLRRGIDVVVADDDVDDRRRTLADELGVELLDRPDADALAGVVASCELVSPAPGVPETHAVVSVARDAGVELASEIELAYRWEQDRPGGPRPMLAITGTDGKTTTTLLAVEMLRAAGVRTIDAGNTSTPLVDAIEMDLDAFVVECTSFRLAWTPTFRAEGAAWLNLAPDHLNWHRSMSTYEAAKAQVWANQRPDDVAVGFIDDPAVMRRLREAPGREVTFGAAGADYHVDTSGDEDRLVGPTGPIARVSAMSRSLPHDLTNALAASALVLETGLADAAAIAEALGSFTGPPHRLEYVGTWNDVAWYNDSKATTPHAAAAAVRSFEQLVLIAGGYDKGVDLAPMAADAAGVDAVIATGDTADRIAAAFSTVAVVEVVADLPEAVDRAAQLARPGATVLLSPGCASFDRYSGFEARGDHFRSLVLDRFASSSTGVNREGSR
ncbi:MAG TPA: UDP-N-acetylmuramoyl-L-alanine--D-glutamate ligase [Ilumatobacteraceae bacterium]|nr:UDP-N-acetylmuramoyl-L-alanine--D-glutamate ligase [Ilumatobacteraceae bacterium]